MNYDPDPTRDLSREWLTAGATSLQRTQSVLRNHVCVRMRWRNGRVTLGRWAVRCPELVIVEVNGSVASCSESVQRCQRMRKFVRRALTSSVERKTITMAQTLERDRYIRSPCCFGEGQRRDVRPVFESSTNLEQNRRTVTEKSLLTQSI